MRLALYHTLLIVFMILGLFPCIYSMGIVGTLSQPSGMGEMRCVALDPMASTAYLVFSENFMWVVNTTDMTQQSLHFSDWPPRESDKVRGCALNNDLVYLVGANEFRAVLTTQGQTLSLSRGVEGKRDLSSPIIISPNSAGSPPLTLPFSPPFIHQFYSSTTNSTATTLFDSNSTQLVELGIIPVGGGVAQGVAYFFGNNKIIKLTEPPTLLTIPFDIGATSPDGLHSYFFGASGTCGIIMHVVDMTLLQLTSSSPLTPPTKHSFCAWFLNYRKLFIDDYYIYFLVYFTQTIYKISRSTLKIEDVLAGGELNTWVYLDGITAGMRMIGYSSSALYVYSRITCNTTSFMIDRTYSLCMTCPFGSKPNRDYSATGCSACEPGTHATSAGTCLQCPAGTYGASAGARNCTSCARGTYSAPGSIDIDACVPCGLGFYGSESGACVPCGAGEYSNVLGATTCAKCIAGTKSDINSTSCSPCPERTYSVEGSENCTLCPVGTYSDRPGLSSCTPCKEGYISFNGSASCTICPQGTYRSSPTSCLLCDEGTHAPSGGTTKCITCPAGQFTSIKGQTRCLMCEKGKFTKDHISCISCNKDMWNSTGLCTPVAYILIGVVGFVVFVAVAVGIVFWWRRYHYRDLYDIEESDESYDEQTENETDESYEEEVIEFDVVD